jgi:hypothetical protein
MPRKLICGALVVLVSAGVPSGATALEREQLPSGVTPLHYDLALVPDAANLSFRGRVQITIDVTALTPAIVLNADELVLDRAGSESQLRLRSTRSRFSSSPAGCEQAYCKGCGREVPMLSIALAAALVGKPERLVYQGVQAGKLHFLEQPSGAILICLQSLGALQ